MTLAKKVKPWKGGLIEEIIGSHAQTGVAVARTLSVVQECDGKLIALAQVLNMSSAAVELLVKRLALYKKWMDHRSMAQLLISLVLLIPSLLMWTSFGITRSSLFILSTHTHHLDG